MGKRTSLRLATTRGVMVMICSPLRYQSIRRTITNADRTEENPVDPPPDAADSDLLPHAIHGQSPGGPLGEITAMDPWTVTTCPLTESGTGTRQYALRNVFR